MNFCAPQAATQSASKSPVIIRVARGTLGGLSGSWDSTVIEPGSIRWETHPAYDWTVKGYPGDHRACKITKQDWEELRKLIHRKTLAGFAGRNGGSASVDQPETWTSVEFSDEQKK